MTLQAQYEHDCAAAEEAGLTAPDYATWFNLVRSKK